MVDAIDAPLRMGKRQPYRLAAGLAVSLALHAVLLFAYRHHLARAPADDPPASRTIAVWLRPAAPPPEQAEPTPQPRPTARREQGKPAAGPARRKQQRASGIVSLPDPSPGQAEPPDVFSVEPSAEPGTHKRFDRVAALQLAREMADDPDPAREGTAVGQIPPKPYATETKMARAVSSAKRRDCKDGLPGGLLGPLLLLMDKKDSGCKW